MAAGSSRGGRGLERYAALGGILYVALFIVGVIVSERGTPGGDAAPAKVIAYYGQGSHRDRIAFGWLIMLVGFALFIVFLGALAQQVRRLSPDDLLVRITLIGGTVYLTAGLVGASLSTAIKTMSDDTYHHEVYPGLIHAAGDSGYVIHSGGGAGAAAMMIAASVAALRARALPAWLCWLGIVGGATAIFSIFFIPWVVIALWLAVTSVLLFVSGNRAATA
jgi:hypothetical protein